MRNRSPTPVVTQQTEYDDILLEINDIIEDTDFNGLNSKIYPDLTDNQHIHS